MSSHLSVVVVKMKTVDLSTSSINEFELPKFSSALDYFSDFYAADTYYSHCRFFKFVAMLVLLNLSPQRGFFAAYPNLRVPLV